MRRGSVGLTDRVGLRGLLLVALAVSGVAVARAAGGGPALSVGQRYEWTHEKRPGFEAWQHYVFCTDFKSARAMTVQVLDHIESYETEYGSSVGSHLDFVFPSHLGCERLDSVEFRPLAANTPEELSTLAWNMVYLPPEQAERASHRCEDRPCVFAPVLRQFIHVTRIEAGREDDGWLRVGADIEVDPNPTR